MNLLERLQGTADISGLPAKIASYTAVADRELLIAVYLSGLAGAGIYKIVVVKTSVELGTYQSPTNVVGVSAGTTTLYIEGGSFAVSVGDTLDIYATGLVGDVAVSTAVEIYDVSVTQVVALVWDELLATHVIEGSVGKTLGDIDPDTLAEIKGLVDDLESRFTAVRACYLDKLNVSGTLAHSDAAETYKADVSGIPEAVMLSIVEDVITLRDSLKIANALLAGKTSGGGSGTVIFRDLADTLNRVIAVVDANNNRTTITRDLT